MMFVYLVTAGYYDEYRVVGAFSSREKADAFMNAPALAELRAKHPDAPFEGVNGHTVGGEWDFNEIEEIELDSLPPTQYHASVQIGVDESKLRYEDCSYYVLRTYISRGDTKIPDATEADLESYRKAIRAIRRKH